MPKRNKNGEQEEKNKVKKKSSHKQITESNVYLAPKEYSSLVSIYLKTIFL